MLDKIRDLFIAYQNDVQIPIDRAYIYKDSEILALHLMWLSNMGMFDTIKILDPKINICRKKW